MADLHVVLGASGGTGSAVVREVADHGLPVRAVNRRGDAEVPHGVERLAADVSTREGALAACDSATVIFHCAQPSYTRWARDFPPLTDAIVEAVAAAGAKLVFADNLYMYGPSDGPLTEETPKRATGKKGRTRVKVAERLLEAHSEGRLRVAIGRSSDYYGPRGTGTVAGERVFRAAISGRRARWLGSLDQPHTLNYLDDMARGLFILATREDAEGQVWHLPAAEPLTGRQFLALVFDAAGRSPRMRATSRAVIRVGGFFVPLVRELNETLYQFEQPFVSDASRFQRVLGPLQPTPHPEAVNATVKWWRARD